jgi:16S rRNA (adenine1518-N6/adenine1519-N6)-dimethyltransferase
LSARVPANVRVVEADFLRVAPDWLVGQGHPVRAAGNLPYNISTPILFRLLGMAADGARVTDATVMLQREVADRLTAHPGTKDWGVLSACQQLRARAEVVLVLPPGAFRPAPKVHSAVVRLTYHPPRPEVRSLDTFDAMVRSIFTLRRKMLSNSLVPFASTRGLDAGAALEAAGLDGHRRPEALEVAELARLADVFASV